MYLNVFNDSVRRIISLFNFFCFTNTKTVYQAALKQRNDAKLNYNPGEVDSLWKNTKYAKICNLIHR